MALLTKTNMGRLVIRLHPDVARHDAKFRQEHHPSNGVQPPFSAGNSCGASSRAPWDCDQAPYLSTTASFLAELCGQGGPSIRHLDSRPRECLRFQDGSRSEIDDETLRCRRVRRQEIVCDHHGPQHLRRVRIFLGVSALWAGLQNETLLPSSRP